MIGTDEFKKNQNGEGIPLFKQETKDRLAKIGNQIFMDNKFSLAEQLLIIVFLEDFSDEDYSAANHCMKLMQTPDLYIRLNHRAT